MERKIVVKIYKDIQKIKEQWEELDQLASAKIQAGDLPYVNYSFYQTYPWNCFLSKTYNGIFYHTVFLIAEEEGEPLMILPLILDRFNKRMRLLSGRIAGILNAACPYQDQRGEAAAEQMLRFLKTEFGKEWKYKFKDIPLHSVFFQTMLTTGVSHSERESYHIPLSEFENYDAYLSSLGKNIYKNIRKSYNHLVTDGKQMSLSIHTVDNPPSRRLLFKIWKLYFQRKLAWNKKKKSLSKCLLSRMRAVMNTVAGRQTKSMMKLRASELYVMTIDGEVAAFMHAYVHDNHVLMPKLAIDTCFARYSPGILLIQESVKLLMERGIVDLDMCRGDERYKIEVGGRMEPLGGAGGRISEWK